ncbi:MAG: hypothetical protein EOS70_28850 [Mesorhizobium sp.]|uniref:Rieske 2Fe-2S domain-containing protein n=1 Tax=Mesorhizobium sp. TaxID=1871066 RepID=UPI000FE8B47D|nr:Rieske 2Fe-2S domain-containing protein [Mesorhizobium sp.]RWC27857.1 MAG: hypothetical protein EOS70_28850 [Mesorhizobium sp.]
MTDWVKTCRFDDIDGEDDHGGQTCAVIGAPDGTIYVSDGLGTHERILLALGMDHVLECPKHNGRFGCRTGKGLKAPICVDLTTYEARIEDGHVFFRAGRA